MRPEGHRRYYDEMLDDIVEWVRQYIKKNRYSPCEREIMAAFDIANMRQTQRLIKRAVDQGKLGKAPGIQRSLHIPRKKRKPKVVEKGRLRKLAERADVDA